MVALAHGCITTALTFTPEIAAQPTSMRVQLKTLPQASRSSRSCEAAASTSIHDVKVITWRISVTTFPKLSCRSIKAS